MSSGISVSIESGNDIMKRITSILLTLTMFISVIHPCQSVIAAEIGKANALAVGNEIAQMCAEYDEDYIENTDLSSTEDKTINTRLIVKADDTIDEYGAVDSVYGLGYVFLQYADKESAETAKNKYERSGYTVDYDSMIIANYSYDYSNCSDEWAYEETDATTALDYYKLKVKSNINIAVLDSGINYNHELFKNRVVRTKVNFSNDSVEDDEIDNFGHGTNVAGAIAKSTPSNVKISAYKIMDSKGYSNASMIVSACNYILELSKKPDIINMSFGGGTGVIIESIIDEIVNTGITVVASAGNDNKEVYEAPALCDSVITVAATDLYGKRCSFTNYGYQVDISAPGEHVYTADNSSNNAYTFANGTSLATPIVSAAAAIVLMENKNYTPEQVKRELIATATPFKKSDCQNLYGAGIVNFSNIINGTRCKDVTTNYQSGVYREDISVELKSSNTLVDIYYTTDGTLPTKTNGTKYVNPIDITESTRIIAAAYARAGSPIHSKYTSLDYYIFKNGEDEYIVDKDGVILNYLGSETDLVVPETINGIAPTAVSQKCFQNNDINSIILPDTVRTINEVAFYESNLKSIKANGVRDIRSHCFYGCDMLSNIDFPELRYIGKESLFDCKSLTQDLEFPLLEWIDERGLAGTYFKTINLPECTKVGVSAFESSTAQEIVLNKATELGSYAFRNCTNLEILYIPKATSLSNCDGCTNLQTIFAPMLENLIVAIPNNTVIYCSDQLLTISFPKAFAEYKCTFVSPRYTPGFAVANDNGHKDAYIHINSDEIAESKGGQIRTRDNGLRFGFEFDENDIGFDFKKYTENVDYGFVYTYKSFEGKNDYQINDSLRVNNSKDNHIRKADKRNVDGDISYYNAVFTNIPKDHLSDKISARAYVCIDGMYFYSPVTTRSFSDVATKIAADDEIDQAIKDEINRLLQKEV